MTLSRLFRVRWFMDFLVVAFLACATAGLILCPKETAAAAREGIALCVDVIIPSLFIFFVISTLTVELGLMRYLGALLEPVMRPLFRLSGPCFAAVVLGFLGGYPVGDYSLVQLLCMLYMGVRIWNNRLHQTVSNPNPCIVTVKYT